MTLKVLLADDNITAQRMGSKILSDAGYTVVAVSNGAAAVKKIASEHPDLCILDVFMPGYSGLEVCEKLKNATATARVPVLLTVTNMEPYRPEDGNRVKADGVLIKPFEATDLLAVLHKFEEQMQPAAAETPVEDLEETIYTEAAPEEAEAKVEMSHEVASAPALGIEHLGPEPAADSEAAPTLATEEISAPEAEVLQPMEVVAEAPASDVDLHVRQEVTFEEVAPVEAEAEMAPPSELEYVSAAPSEPMDVVPAADVEVTEEVAVAQDPELVTEPAELAQLATEFDAEEAEDIPIGIAMEEAPAETEAFEEVLAPEHEAEAPMEEASGQFVEQEMRHGFGSYGGVAAAVALAREAVAETAVEVGDDTQPLPPMEDAPKPEMALMPLMEAFPRLDMSPVMEADPGLDTQPLPVLEAEAEAVIEAQPVVMEAEAEARIETEPLPVLEAEAETGIEAQPVVMEAVPEIASFESAATVVTDAPDDIPHMRVAQFAEELERAQAEAAAQLPRAVEAEMEPPAEAAVASSETTHDHVAEAVQRVLDRYKSELVAAIVRELKS